MRKYRSLILAIISFIPSIVYHIVTSLLNSFTRNDISSYYEFDDYYVPVMSATHAFYLIRL